MKQEINLEEIIDKNSGLDYDEDGNQIYHLWEVKDMLQQACLETLELAADNAEIDDSDILWKKVNKLSILNLKNKIK